MVSREDIAKGCGGSPNMIAATVGQFVHLDRVAGDFQTAMASSVTVYHALGIMGWSGQLKAGMIKAHAPGIGATTTLDVLKVPSGTAVTAGVAMVTQVATNALTADTNYQLAVKSDGSQNFNAGDTIVVKIVTQGTETLTSPAIQLVLG